MQQDRTVVITGAAGGIGSAIVKRFLANDDFVVAVDCDAQALELLRQRHAGGGLVAVTCDITSEGDCDRVAEVARDQTGRVDVLVNCAGYYPIQPFEEMTLAQWRHIIDINLTGHFVMTRALLPLMKGRNWGRVINIGSGSIFEGVAGQTHYVAAKAGLLGFTRSLAMELGDYGITVNMVAPGLTLTEPVKSKMKKAMIESQLKSRAIARDEQPEDLAGPVFFLASPDADFMSGQTLTVDGGKIKR